MKKLLNPRGYLSPSQISLWMRNREKYIEQYVHGGEGYTNAKMQFGSKAALALETGEKTDDEMINMLVQLLPRYDKREYTMRVPFETKNGMVELLGKMDTYNSDDHSFMDDKTGTTKWTQSMANKLKQLHHYAAMIYLKYGKLPPKIHLNWAKTEVITTDEGRVVQLTGEVQTFEVKITLKEVLEYLALVSKVALEIDQMYREEIKKLT